MGRRIVIRWPQLPPPELRGNSRAHWRTKAAQAKAVRNSESLWFSLYAIRESFNRARIQYRFHVRDKRRRDPDNWVIGMKNVLDCIVQAGILPDDSAEHVTILSPEFFVTKMDKPLTEIIIEEE